MFAVRPARVEDHTALCALFDELDEFHRQARPELFRPFEGPARTLGQIGQWLKGPGSTVLVADDAGDVVAHLIGTERCRLAQPPRAESAEAPLLVGTDRLERRPEPQRRARLDLTDHPGAALGQHQVQLTLAASPVPIEQAVAPLEVPPGSQLLAGGSQALRVETAFGQRSLLRARPWTHASVGEGPAEQHRVPLRG